MVNYGLAYGMNAWGLAQRLDIAPDEAQEIMDAYFASFPAIREYLDRQVGHATVEGFTETILGRRRYIPELQAANPRVRDLGRRQALNAPIQGSASDVFKVAMIEVDGALREQPDLDCHMLLTVHDELVFEVPEVQRRGGGRAREGPHGARGRARGAARRPTSAGARTGPTPPPPATDARHPSGLARLTAFPLDTYPVHGRGFARVPLAQSQTASGEPRAPEGEPPR